MRWTREKLPVARRDDLVIEELGDETVAYDVQTKDAHCLTPLAAAVFARADGRSTIEDLAAHATERLGEPIDAEKVLYAIAQLEERDLMVVSASRSEGGMSRRDMLRRSAVVGGTAFAAPLIVSVGAPPAVAAASATCADILCCPCCQESNLNKEECCTTPATVNCQCTGNRDPGPPSAKYCKPAGASAPDDAFCLANRPADCASKQLAGAACDTCTTP